MRLWPEDAVRDSEGAALTKSVLNSIPWCSPGPNCVFDERAAGATMAGGTVLGGVHHAGLGELSRQRLVRLRRRARLVAKKRAAFK